jgi:hypothetical protein
VVVTAGGFCQTDTLLARRARVLFCWARRARQRGGFSKFQTVDEVVAVVDRETSRARRDGSNSPLVLGRGHFGCDSA